MVAWQIPAGAPGQEEPGSDQQGLNHTVTPDQHDLDSAEQCGKHHQKAVCVDSSGVCKVSDCAQGKAPGHNQG